MSGDKRIRAVWAAVGAATLAITGPPAIAQDAVRPPRVESPGATSDWLYYLVGFGGLAVCVGMAVFPSKRTHED